MQTISKYFEKAKLPIIVETQPMGRGFMRNDEDSKRIFQMTIDQGKKEAFRVYKGQGNDVRVLDVDKDRRQVVLFVKEPKRKFTTKRFDRNLGKDVIEHHETPDHIRRYLMGMDETHLFIAELPGQRGKINSVDDAHKILKPYEVKDRKKRKDSKVKRQGEWFFIDPTPAEMILIEDELKNPLLMHLKKDEPISRNGGKPHTVENRLQIGETIFIKGKVKHPDHRTIEFFSWVRVFRNTEITGRTNFGGWID